MATQIESPERDTVIAPAPRIPRESNVRQAGYDGPKAGASGRSTTRSHAVALAGLQLLLGYEWLVSGVDKLLYPSFPAALGTLLVGTLRGGQVPAPFAAFLRAVALPHSVAFGVLVEWGETLAGLGLIAGALVALLAPVAERRLVPAAMRWIMQGERAMTFLAPAAALATALMGLSFYLLDGAPSLLPMPSIAFGGALDTGLFLALGSAMLLVDALANWLTGRIPER